MRRLATLAALAVLTGCSEPEPTDLEREVKAALPLRICSDGTLVGYNAATKRLYGQRSGFFFDSIWRFDPSANADTVCPA